MGEAVQERLQTPRVSDRVIVAYNSMIFRGEEGGNASTVKVQPQICSDAQY